MPRLMDASELCEALIGLTEKGLVVPVWCAEHQDIIFWPAHEAPPDATPMTVDEIRAHFKRHGPSLTPQWN